MQAGDQHPPPTKQEALTGAGGIMEAKHTATPWHIGGTDKSTIYDELGQRVANSFEGVMVTQRSDKECQENATFIVRACNEYDELKRKADRADKLEKVLKTILSTAEASHFKMISLLYLRTVTKPVLEQEKAGA
jgi:hypothetical protein